LETIGDVLIERHDEMNKRGILVANGSWQSKKVDELMEWIVRAASKEGIKLTRVNNDELLVMIEGGVGSVEPSALIEVDFVLFWDKDLLLAKQFENIGIRVYNSSEAIEVCDNKMKTHQALAEAGIPMPTTIFAPFIYNNMVRKNFEYLDRVIAKLGFPLVVKEAYGSFGQQVALMENRKDLETWILKVGGRPHLYQQYIQESHGEDLRINVVGGKVVAAMKRSSKTDFRANITLGGRMESYQPSEEEADLAIGAAARLGLDFAGVDLLQTQAGSVVCEVNSNVHFITLAACTGIDTAAHVMRWIKSGERIS
jgi:ribosomal protein S6--L-glutamate ligase/gamma-F420-2:alpha-L-glutamate ligase